MEFATGSTNTAAMLRLAIGGYQEIVGGTGGQFWDAAVVLALFLRAHADLVRDHHHVGEARRGRRAAGHDHGRGAALGDAHRRDSRRCLTKQANAENGADVNVALSTARDA